MLSFVKEVEKDTWKRHSMDGIVIDVPEFAKQRKKVDDVRRSLGNGRSV